MSKFSEWFYKRQNGWFTFCAIFAFASVISFFQGNSYWADQHNFNGWFIGWKGVGGLFGLAAIFCYWKAKGTSTGKAG